MRLRFIYDMSILTATERSGFLVWVHDVAGAGKWMPSRDTPRGEIAADLLDFLARTIEDLRVLDLSSHPHAASILIYLGATNSVRMKLARIALESLEAP